jgi:hypothetical protein
VMINGLINKRTESWRSLSRVVRFMIWNEISDFTTKLPGGISQIILNVELNHFGRIRFSLQNDWLDSLAPL